MNDSNPKIDPEKMAERYKAMLNVSGTDVSGEKDEGSNTYDVKFDYKGMKFVAVFDYDDPSFVRIICPNFYPAQELPKDKDKLSAVIAAVMKSNSKCKGAKLFLSRNNTDVSAVIEFLEQADSTGAGILNQDTLDRHVAMLLHAVLYARVAFDI